VLEFVRRCRLGWRRRLGYFHAVSDLFDQDFEWRVGVPRILHAGLVVNEFLRCQLVVCLKKIGKEFAEAGIGKTDVAVTLGAQVDGFDGVGELIFKALWMLVYSRHSCIFLVWRWSNALIWAAVAATGMMGWAPG
jgi:hypothetical protein